MGDNAGTPKGVIGRVLEEFRSMPASLIVIYINVSLYALCYQMQAPVQPELVKSLGACV